VERGYKALLDRLVRAAVEGNAWNADHVVPVFRGGGACGLENLRTLCCPCHADITKTQAKERAAERCARIFKTWGPAAHFMPAVQFMTRNTAGSSSRLKVHRGTRLMCLRIRL